MSASDSQLTMYTTVWCGYCRRLKTALKSAGIAFTEAPIPGWAIQQLFLHDPRGLRIEMTFWMDQEEGAAA